MTVQGNAGASSTRIRTFRRARARGVAGGVAVTVFALLGLLLAACGGSSVRPLPKATAEADKPPAAIVADAERALQSAGSVHVVGQVQASQPISIDLTVGKNADGQPAANGTVVRNGVHVDVIRLGGTIYLRGDKPFYDSLGPAVAPLVGKWLSLRVTQADDYGAITDTSRLLRISTSVPLTKEGVQTVAGQPAVIVRATDPTAGTLRLAVAAQGLPYPLRVERMAPTPSPSPSSSPVPSGSASGSSSAGAPSGSQSPAAPSASTSASPSAATSPGASPSASPSSSLPSSPAPSVPPSGVLTLSNYAGPLTLSAPQGAVDLATLLQPSSPAPSGPPTGSSSGPAVPPATSPAGPQVSPSPLRS